ncbi:DNA cytosine methyltransferase [Comamonas antarctica]|uniref:DNA cytosine methyltransferase n=1 Tax=Comamonas antarctica TaxID=2743470 RepID=UPI0028EF80B6|nr:DNA cytosine methyltransferase [Comamonas antarctica]
MTRPAYYNEIDKYAAQWLRNLISAGHIAHGVVDERSIEDVRPSDLSGFAQCHFFAGIGVWSHSLRRAGWRDDRAVWTASCPCQPFSAAGQGAGFDDQRHLWPHLHWLIQQCRPPIVLGEQVASKDAEPWLDLVQTDLEVLGYGFGAVPFPATSVGAPHIRDRLYWVAHSADARLEGRDQGTLGRQRTAVERGGRVVGLAYGDSLGRESQLFGAGSTGLDSWSDDERALFGLEPRGQAGGLGHAHGEHAGRNAGAGSCPQAECELWCCGDVFGAPGATGRLEHAGHHHDAGEGPAASAGQPQADGSADQSGGSGVSSGGLADANGRHAGAERQQRRGEQRQQPQDCRGGVVASGRLADADMQCEGPADDATGVGDARRAEQDCRPGPVNGMWSAADWLLCRDGKWRPVEPGTFPLVDGTARSLGRVRADQERLAALVPRKDQGSRVGRLKAYGNAICAPAAQVFIESVMEAVA